jgi:single-strand DNA-binding protein
MNQACLVGNLTKNPELRTTQNGISTCTFTIAVNRRKGADGVQKADFIPVVTWRQQAENCARYLAKGRKVAVVGSIQTRNYDAHDGTKRYVTEIIATEVTFLPNGSGNNASGNQQQGQDNGYDDGAANASAGASAGDGFTQVSDDELPF